MRLSKLFRFRILGALAALLLSVALASCSAVSLLYSQLDSALYLWVDKYVDLSHGQALLFKARSKQLLSWHRKTELPRYAVFMEKSAALMPGDIPAAEYCSKYQEFTDLTRATIWRAIPDIAELAITNDDEQIEHLKRKLESNNKDWMKKNLPATAEKRHQVLVEQSVERYEDFYGDVSREQEKTISKLLENSPWDPQRWYAERKRRQQVMIALLQELRATDKANAEKKISQYAEQYYTHPDANEEKWIQSLRSFACQFNAAFHKQTTAKQREYAQKKLMDYAKDFRTLAIN